MSLSQFDIIVLVIYFIVILALALWVSRDAPGHKKDTQDYFLAGHSLPWWAVGASLIAANISAEQIIGMSGSGFAIGLAISAYEWMAAITLILVGKYLLPILLEKGIYTMPEFLEQRYDHRVRLVLAIFWLAVYIFVNLTSVLYLGGLAINTLTGLPIFYGILGLAAFCLLYSIYGGLKAVALTDIIQVVLLIFGGLIITYLSLDSLGNGGGALAGFKVLSEQASSHFDLILDKNHPHYISLPGISVLIGGMWIMNISYWGLNQYITQRALAAKNLQEAQKGVAFAGYLKLLMPFIIVIPGIAAFLLAPDLEKPDQAYPELMKLVPSGLRGLTFAALIAAIVSSLASMSNSIATISTMDIYKRFLKPDAKEQHLVIVGRSVIVIALIIAVASAQPLLGSLDQAFQYIQEFTGFFTPGIVAIFLLGMFWKKATAHSALTAAITSVVLSIIIKKVWPEYPFMDRMMIVFISACLLAIIVAYLEGGKDQDRAIDLRHIQFKTSSTFNWAGIGIALILCVLYGVWW